MVTIPAKPGQKCVSLGRSNKPSQSGSSKEPHLLKGLTVHAKHIRALWHTFAERGINRPAGSGDRTITTGEGRLLNLIRPTTKNPMKVATVNSLGFDMTKTVPENNAEYDQLAKVENAACDHATSSTLYRSTFPVFRDIFLHGCDADGDLPALVGVEEETGIERAKKDTDRKDSDGNFIQVWDETESKYFTRVCAELKLLTKEQIAARFGEKAQAAMDRAPFDPSVKERKSSGPRKPAKTWVKIATAAVKEGKATVLADKLSAVLGHEIALPEDEAGQVEVLAAAITENEKRKADLAKQEYAV